MSLHRLRPLAAEAPREAAPWRLHPCGEPRLVDHHGATHPLDRRAAALAVLVALEPGISRERAATLLWPESLDPRRNLRQQLLRLRQAVGRPVVEGAERLQLEAGIEVEADDALPLLATWSVADDDFGAWLLARRQQRVRDRLAALAAWRQQAEAEGRLDDAVALAHQAEALDPDSEAPRRELMRLLYLRGDVAGALAAYEQLRQRLARLHGAQPSAETEQIARALRAAGAGAGPETGRHPPAAPLTRAAAVPMPVTLLRPPRLVGRQRELAQLHDGWANARVGLLRGEAGLGKSRLLAEFTHGRHVAQAAGRPGDRGIPYATLARLLRPLVAAADGRLPASQRRHLAPALPDATALPAADAPAQRLALHQAVQALLANAQQHGAALDGVVVDDLHFADDASVECLLSLAADPAVSQRWLFAQRPAEGGGAAADLRQTLEETGRLQTVDLAPLDEAEMHAFVDALDLPGLTGASIAPALWRHSGGNPLFALETLRLGLADGSLRSGRLPRPASVGALIERRLTSLGERALALARVAAIAGADFDVELAEAIIGVPAVDLADAWLELERAQVLRDGAFAHDLVHDACLHLTPAVVARRLHQRCASVLDARNGEPARRASHWEAAGDHGRAGPLWVQAAQRARAATREAEAVQLLDHALALPGWDEQARFDAAALRVEAIANVDWGDRYTAAVAALNDLARTPAQRATATLRAAVLANHRQDSPQAMDLARASAGHARQAGDTRGYLIARQALAEALLHAGRSDEALATLREDEAAACAHSPEAEVAHRSVLGSALAGAHRVAEARVEFGAGLQRASAHGLVAHVDALLTNLAVCEHALGRNAAALDLYQQAGRHAAAHELAGASTVFLALGTACAMMDLNRYADAWPWIERAEADVRSGAPAVLAQAVALRARWYVELGQPERALPLLQGVVWPERTTASAASQAALVESHALAALGRDPRTALKRALAQAQDERRRPHVAWEARLNAVLLGAADLAGDLAALATQARSRGFVLHAACADLLLPGPLPASRVGAAIDTLADPDLSPRWLYRGAVWRAALAHSPRAAAPAARWFDDTRARQVPAEFVHAFEQRQPANLALRKALAQADAATRS